MIKVWQPVDEMFLRDKWGKMDLADIARTLGKTSNACNQKARKLGLKRKALENDIQHQKMNDTASRPANRLERLFMGWVVMRGCSVPGCNKPPQFHHEPLRSSGCDHTKGAGLCQYHHQDGVNGRHGMSRDRFNEKYGIDILKIAEGNWAIFLREVKPNEKRV